MIRQNTWLDWIVFLLLNFPSLLLVLCHSSIDDFGLTIHRALLVCQVLHECNQFGHSVAIGDDGAIVFGCFAKATSFGRLAKTIGGQGTVIYSSNRCHRCYPARLVSFWFGSSVEKVNYYFGELKSNAWIRCSEVLSFFW